jgi:hypothetical protein
MGASQSSSSSSRASSQENAYIPSTLLFQELERLKFAQNLRKNPAEYSAYVRQRVDQMTNDVMKRKQTAFQKAQIDLGRYMDMDHNANFYKSRTADVDRLLAGIESNNTRLAQSVQYDKDITRRQFEINEWYNYNKLETLFFLQLFFIAALSSAIVVFVQKNGMITTPMASLLYGILAVIVAGTGLYRYFYTTRTRDPRLWHRRYFGDATPPKKPVQCDKNGNLVFDVNDVIPKSVTQCVDDASGRFDKWQKNLEEEMLQFQKTGGGPATQVGSICSVAK